MEITEEIVNEYPIETDPIYTDEVVVKIREFIENTRGSAEIEEYSEQTQEFIAEYERLTNPILIREMFRPEEEINEIIRIYNEENDSDTDDESNIFIRRIRREDKPELKINPNETEKLYFEQIFAFIEKL
jgi:hypothetical protein